MNKLKSRKFWLAFGSILAIFLTEIIGIDLDPEALKAIVWAVAAYIIGEGAVDTARMLNRK